MNKTDCVHDVDRFDTHMNSSIYVHKGACLNNIDSFDNTFFGISDSGSMLYGSTSTIIIDKWF